MSFGSAMRFEVKDGGKGGIFWNKEKPKQKPRKFGYKTKGLRHPIRKPEEPEEVPAEKVKPSTDFIKRNREQYRKTRPDEDKENHHSTSSSSTRPSSQIKPGTVTLTQDQLNALLASVGKLKPGESNIRISIDADNNRLLVDSPHDAPDSAPNSARSGGDQDSGNGEVSIFDLAQNKNNNGQHDNRDSSGYGSEDKSSGGKEVRFNTARNEERARTPEAAPVPPPLVPWRHMTVAERKRLQWAREKAAEEELQKQKNYDPWGRPGAGAPPPKSEPEAEPEPAKQFKTEEEQKLREAVDAIEAKYSDLLKPPDQGKAAAEQQEKLSDHNSDSGAIPGLDSSYSVSTVKLSKAPKAKEQLEDKGNTRPSKKSDRHADKQDRREDRTDRREDRRERGDRGRAGRRGDGEPDKRRNGEGRKDEDRAVERRTREEQQEERYRERKRQDQRDRERQTEEGRRGERKTQEEQQRGRVSEGPGDGGAGGDTFRSGPAAMQTSLFIGQAEPDNTVFLTRKELEKKKWLEELDRQREEKRLQVAREKERQRQGVDDTWADRFVTPGARQPPPSQTQPLQQQQQQQYQQQQQQQQQPAAIPGAWERSAGQSRTGEASPLPPAAMRSAMAIGDVAPNLSRIEQRQAEEKRQWLEELNKQREEQREARLKLQDKQRASEETWASRFTQPNQPPAAAVTPHNAPLGGFVDNTTARVNSAPQAAVNESLDEESTTFLRGQNVHLDPVTKRELEEKRRKHLEYQSAIKAQIEEKEKQKREERERKWREEMEEERKLKAERDSLQRQLEAEDSKNRQKEEARQRQVEQLKTMMDAEQERAQEERMLKRLSTLQQAGHDITGLKAHYEEPGVPAGQVAASLHPSGAQALTPRRTQVTVDPASVPGLLSSPRDAYTTGPSPGPGPATFRLSQNGGSLRGSQEVATQPVQHAPYMENRVLTPSRFRQPSQPVTYPTSPLREFATQTDEGLQLLKEPSEVEIEYRHPPPHNEVETEYRQPPPSNQHRQPPPPNRKETRARGGQPKPDHPSRASSNPAGKPPPARQGRQQQQQQQQQQKQKRRGKPGTWNYQNPGQKAPVKQSEKDPFFEQKKLESEERRAKRERQLQYLVELNKQVIPTEKESRPLPPADHTHQDDARESLHSQAQGQGGVAVDSSRRSRSPPVNTNGKYRPQHRGPSPPVPAVKRKAGHSTAKDLETDYRTDTHNHHRRDRSYSPVVDERGNIVVPTKDTDFIPILRTTDVLDPAKAEEPVQLSRENTRIKEARQRYHENLRPAHYGNQLNMYEDQQRQPAPRNKDPILNPGLVKDHPTARQDQILQQLSSLKQSLIQRRREIETCMSPSDLEKHV